MKQNLCQRSTCRATSSGQERSTVGGGKARSVGRGQEIRRELRAKRFTACEKRGLHQNLDNVLRKKVCSFCSSPTGLEVCLPERSIHQLETGLP